MCVQIADVEDIGAGVVTEVDLVDFIVDQKIAGVVGQPALVGVGASTVCSSRDLHRRVLVGDIDDGDRVFVGSEADLATDVIGIRTQVVHALGIMSVAVAAETAGESGCQR